MVATFTNSEDRLSKPALDVVTNASDQFALSRQQRDEAIIEARQSGATLREIAAAAHLTHTGVSKIIDKAVKGA